jgi:hypothetical protein
MRSWGLVCLAVAATAGAGWAGAQEPGLTKRPAEATKALAAKAAVPAAMAVPAQLEAAKAANGDAVYRALRERMVNGPAFAVKDLTLRRDAGVFTLRSGTIYLFGETGGRVTGAVFEGEGSLHVEPPSAMERRQLKAVMKTEVLDQRFTSAVFSFTDDTAAELKRGAGTAAAATGEAQGRADEDKTLFRRDLHVNLEARLLEDVGRPGGGGGGLFLAAMKGPMFSTRLLFEVDPRGAMGVSPEEVGLLTSSEAGYDVTLGFRDESHRKAASEAANAGFRVGQQTIDARIASNGRLTGTSVTAVTSERDGLQVVPLQLFPTLRVSGVWGPKGEALDFVQEDKLKDSDFAVVLKKPLAKGETAQITTSYAGKDSVSSEGNGNYFLVARESWYPNMRGAFGNYAYYTMTFHTAKDVQVVATGNRLKEDVEGKVKTSVWQSLVPMPVAGFNMGEFKSDQSERNKDVQVVSYANTELADHYGGLVNAPGMALGTLSTTGMLKVATSEGDASVQIYTDFFGPLPYDHVSLTQQTACNYGQSWPTLVYLPICYFWDNTQKHQLGLLDSDPTYWKVVTPHEVAHQWWGQTVGFASYRDQWMSEGFANFSASLFLLETNKSNKEYRDFWTLLRKRLLEKNTNGFRPVDVGPVVMGTRVDTSKTGDVYEALIYDKGAYILHSLDALFWSAKYGDVPFKKAMHDFVSSYTNKPATTEDFKAVMERNLPAWLDIEPNHGLDWFFDAYVYGTAVPKYTLTYDFSQVGDSTKVHFKLKQENVPEDFRMLVPIYLELADGRVVLLGRVPMHGVKEKEQTVDLGKAPSPAKRLIVNYNFDLLSE